MASGSFLGAKKRHGSENLVALAELRDVYADGFDFPGHLLAQYLDSFVWPQEAEKIRKGSQNQAGNEMLRASQSPTMTVAPGTLIRTSLSLGVGFSISRSWRTSGEPYFSNTIAFIILEDVSERYQIRSSNFWRIARPMRPPTATPIGTQNA